ncbi:GDSL-type esterase/lipase family protein [Mesobacillus zeae]|nr:GDSL-type esterase/lipase family protein [Mesobacillus zeae]
MRLLKLLVLLIILAGSGAAIWMYYPYYQISTLKKQTSAHSQDGSMSSYIDHFKESDTEQLHLLALGDSVIAGYGASEADSLVGKFADGLARQTSKTVVSKNEGINGLTSERLNSLIQSGVINDEISSANIIMINVGGNDILRAARDSDFGSAIKTFDRLQSDFTENLAGITEGIRYLNPNATIIFLELYNPLPTDHSFYSLSDKLLPKWNVHLYKAAQQFDYAVVVHTTKVIHSSKPDHLSPDGVHPSLDGYEAISQQALEQFASEPWSEGK